MDVIDHIYAACRAVCPTIVLPEGADARIQSAALEASRLGLARIVLIDGPDDIAARSGADAISVRPAADAGRIETYGLEYLRLRGDKCAGSDAARAAMALPLAQAAMMVRLGEADGTVAGAVATTAETVRTALRIIGPAAGVKVVSSSFLMLFQPPMDRPVVFADCGLVMQPRAEELASIAIAAAETLVALTGAVPRIAMLSFSTHGSADEDAHESIGRIKRAVSMVRRDRPDLLIDGELQFDAALVPEVARAKAPASVLGGQANVFVFPSLSAGNIGYKIAHRVGNAVALGPILQGLARPANDLSRGCGVRDVLHMIAITGAQIALQRKAGGADTMSGQVA